MKITEDKGKTAKLRDLNAGTVFRYAADYWILTDYIVAKDSVRVVRLNDGYWTTFSLDTLVTVINAEVIIY